MKFGQFWGLALLISAMSLNVSSAQRTSAFNAGLSRFTTEVAQTEVSIRLFYPTLEAVEHARFGPWRVAAKTRAEPATGPFPLILVSHGLGGNSWNHHLMATELVASGFVVGALDHPDDLMRVGRPEHLILRPLELVAALDAVIAHPVFGPLIDETRVGAFGFSLGGCTVLAAAGGYVDFDRITNHCAQSQNDSEYCGKGKEESLPLRLKTRRRGYSISKVDLDQTLRDPRLKALVAAAPVGVPFDRMDEVAQPLLLMKAGADQQLRAPYHADHIHDLLPGTHEYQVFEGLHHYAFLSPFPDAIAHEVGEPAQDPSGFDRAKFLQKLNSDIGAFFRDHLGA